MMEKKSFEGLILRKYSPSDFDEIITLFHNTVHHINIRDYTPEQVDAWAPSEIDPIRWKVSLEENFTMVVEGEKGEILGFGNLSEEGYLDFLFVHMSYQGSGIASRILEALELRARSLGLVEIHTESSISARSFFESRGFISEKEQEKPCRGVNLTNFIMKKTLT